jgi:hypothetical protein
MANASAARHVEQSSETTPLEVVVSHPTDKTEAEAGIIVITITNHSSKSLLLPRIRTALGGFEPRRQRGLLVRVINPAGKAARYTGTFISFSESTPRRDRYIRIDPGQTIAGEIDLSLDYDLSAGGVYYVSYEQEYGGDELLADGNIPKDSITSNTLDIWANTSLIGAQHKHLVTIAAYPGEQPASYPGERPCSPEEFSKISSAASKLQMQVLPNVYGAAGWKLYRLEKDNATIPPSYNATLVPDERYEIWFGKPSNSLKPSYVEEDRYLTSDEVWNSEDFMPLHIASAVKPRVAQMTFACGCPSNFPQGTGAVARTSDPAPYRTSVCDIFFSLPEDSRMLTIAHEMSHFRDDLADGTQDYSAGPEDSRNLARDDHSQAVMSADNFGYWLMGEWQAIEDERNWTASGLTNKQEAF